MKITSRTTTEDYLRKTKLPQATKTYTVIPHGVIIDAIRKKLEENGFVVTAELYKSDYNGDIAMGFMQIQNDQDPDMGMTFNFTNSYNKMLRFGCSVGGFIYDNEVPFLSSNNSATWIRKHTGTADSEAMEVIDAMISSANEHFQEIINMKENLKSIQVDRKEYAKLIGLLYLDKEILFPDQVSTIKNEYKKPSFDYKDKGTLWELYKMIMFAIAEKSPKIWHDQQMKISSYIQVMYNFAKVAVANEEQASTLEFEFTEEEDDTVRLAQYPVTTEDAFPPVEENNTADFITDEMEDEVMDMMFTPILPTPKSPCAAHDEETVKDEMEPIENLIQAQNMIQDAKPFVEPEEEVVEIIEDDFELVEEDTFIDLSDIEGEYTLDEMPAVIETIEERIEEAKAVTMSEEQIELVKEDFGIVEKGNPNDGLIGSKEQDIEEANSLFDLIDDEDDDSADEVPWFTDENPQMDATPSLIPEPIREEVNAILSERYGNKRKVTNVNKASESFIVELDSHEFFVVN